MSEHRDQARQWWTDANGQPLTSMGVAEGLASLGADLEEAVRLYEQAEYDYANKSRAYEQIFARALLDAQGQGHKSEQTRRAYATIEADEASFEKELAEILLRVLKMKIKTIEYRIEVGRSLGAAIRSEVNLAGYQRG